MCDGISNHQLHDCLLNRLFRHRSKKTSKLRVTGLREGYSLPGEFPAQRASNAENVSIWWRHHDNDKLDHVITALDCTCTSICVLSLSTRENSCMKSSVWSSQILVRKVHQYLLGVKWEKSVLIYWYLQIFRNSKWINTSRPKHDGCHFVDSIFKCGSSNENVWILNEISFRYVPGCLINDWSALVWVMA